MHKLTAKRKQNIRNIIRDISGAFDQEKFGVKRARNYQTILITLERR